MAFAVLGVLLRIVVVAGLAWSVVTCWTKGKRATVAAGVALLLVSYALYWTGSGTPIQSGALVLAATVVWVAGASRLARPTSDWATTLYDDPRLGRSWQRFGTMPEGPPQPPYGTAYRPRAMWPSASRTALWVAGAAVLVAAGSVFALVTAAAAAPSILLAAAGRRRYRVVAAATAALGAVATVALTAPAGAQQVLYALPGLVVLGVAVAFLFRPRMQEWLR